MAEKAYVARIVGPRKGPAPDKSNGRNCIPEVTSCKKPLLLKMRSRTKHQQNEYEYLLRKCP